MPQLRTKEVFLDRSRSRPWELFWDAAHLLENQAQTSMRKCVIWMQYSEQEKTSPNSVAVPAQGRMEPPVTFQRSLTQPRIPKIPQVLCHCLQYHPLHTVIYTGEFIDLSSYEIGFCSCIERFQRSSIAGCGGGGEREMCISFFLFIHKMAQSDFAPVWNPIGHWISFCEI